MFHMHRGSKKRSTKVIFSTDPFRRVTAWLIGSEYKTAIANALQRQNTEISKQIFPEKEYRGLSPSFHIHAPVNDLYIPAIGLPNLLEEICRSILGLYKSLTHRNVEIRAEAALFPEKEYINGIFVAVWEVLIGIKPKII